LTKQIHVIIVFCQWKLLILELRYGFQSHRVAIWIYWQALVLIYKGLPLHGLPSKATKQAAETGASHPRDALHGQFFTWRPPQRWPWSAAYYTSSDPPSDTSNDASAAVDGCGTINEDKSSLSTSAGKKVACGCSVL
jgi:hypothetical protein